MQSLILTFRKPCYNFGVAGGDIRCRRPRRRVPQGLARMGIELDPPDSTAAAHRCTVLPSDTCLGGSTLDAHCNLLGNLIHERTNGSRSGLNDQVSHRLDWWCDPGITSCCATRVDSHRVDSAALPWLSQGLRMAKSPLCGHQSCPCGPDHHPASCPDLWLPVIPPQPGPGFHCLGVYNSSWTLMDHQSQTSFLQYSGSRWVKLP